MFPRALIFFLLIVFQPTVFSACSDGINNVVKMSDASANNPLQLTDGAGLTYDSGFAPSCYKNVANLKFPGFMNLISGTFTVNKQLSVVGNSKILLTLKKNSRLIGTVCEDGKSKSAFVPDSDWLVDFLCFVEDIMIDFSQIDVCKTENPMCKILETPGVYKLGDLEHDLGVNGTIPLSSIPGSLKSLIKGQWSVEMKLQIGGGDIVFHIKIPSDTKWIWLDE